MGNFYNEVICKDMRFAFIDAGQRPFPARTGDAATRRKASSRPRSRWELKS